MNDTVKYVKYFQRCHCCQYTKILSYHFYLTNKITIKILTKKQDQSKKKTSFNLPIFSYLQIMKKNKQTSGTAKKKVIKIEDKEPETTEKAPVKVDSLDDEEQGFGGWLR